MLGISERSVIADVLLHTEKCGKLARAAVLCAVGIFFLTIAAKISIPFWPVPVTMQTFFVLMIGTAYGSRLGVSTVAGYLILGTLALEIFGMNMFANSANGAGFEYLFGSTGGYLFGFILAAALMGYLAQKKWDRSYLHLAAAMALGNAVIYVPGVLWLGYVIGWDKPVLQLGFINFLLGDTLKLLLAVFAVPSFWRTVRNIQ
jgi:biotin transport system substrate-specific component